MKIPDVIQTLELSGIDKSQLNYSKIIPNATIMSILNSRLYKNKIGSVVREALSNAKDACKEINSSQEIVFHAPTLLEPYFSIQDYGVGMSEDTIVNIFSAFGESTKRKSDDFIGGYGIGCHTASAYNNQFTVTSVKDGIRNVYQFFKDEAGMPCNCRMDQSKTDEPSGTEIRIAVNNATDFEKFFKEIEYYSRWIDHPVSCNRSIDPRKPEFFEENKDFGITKFATNSRNMGVCVVGSIIYEFDFGSCGFSSHYYEGIAGVKPDFLILFANINDVDVIGSREELEYSEKTIKFVKSKVALIKIWYQDYLKSKTKFWLHQNTQSWEKTERKWFTYNFPILSKTHGKWQTQQSAKVYEKYITLDNFTDKLAWLVAAKKVGGNADTVAFILKTDKQNLINLGADPSCIYSFDDLPKQKRGKLAKYKICCLKIKGANSLNKELGFCRTDKLEKKHFNIQSTILKKTYSKTLIKEILEKNGPISITVDDAQSCGFVDYLKGFLGEKNEVSYCNAVKALQKLGFIKTLTVNKKDDKDSFRRAFGLISGENVNLSDKFPLLSYCDWTYNYPKGTELTHANDYVSYVLKKTPNALTNKHLQVLSTSPSGKSN